jgi:ribulose 1,5-bisphosphate synthetase/thiazole synthase
MPPLITPLIRLSFTTVSFMTRQFDITIVGGGHAGCEADSATAKPGMNVLVAAVWLDSDTAIHLESS